MQVETTITVHLPLSYQSSTGFQSISELISTLLHVHTSRLVFHLSLFVINTSSASAVPPLTQPEFVICSMLQQQFQTKKFFLVRP